MSETGKCLEGLTLEQCPHYEALESTIADESAERPSAVSGQEPDGESTEDAAAANIALRTGEKLSTFEAGAILRAYDARVIAVIGTTDAGKTSLIASLYDLFQRGPAEEFAFTRSATFAAFERACHHARAASQRDTPHTDRTPVGHFGFYHLGVLNKSTSALLDLLIGDRSGEEYLEAANDPRSADGFHEVRRADAITVLADGRRLMDIGQRHNLQSDILMILQGLVDGDIIERGCTLALVLTKLDEVEQSEDCSRVKDDFNNLCAKVKQVHGEAFDTISMFEVAASPKTNLRPRGHGMLELLRFWTPPPVAPESGRHPVSAPLRAIARLTPAEE